MIGVAFALRGTFGRSDGIAETALANVLQAYVRARRLTVDVSGPYRTAIARTPIASPAALRHIAAAVLGPRYRPEDDRKLEARFRNEAAGLVATRFVPYDDVAPTLADLARLNVPLAALGDGWPSIDERTAHAVGFTGAVVHGADVAGDAPAPSPFEEVARRLRVPIERVWFVGTDLAREIVPAATAGAHTIWIARDGAGAPTGGVTPDATVGTFGDIRDVLGAPYTRGLLELRYVMRTSLDWRPGYTIGSNDTFAPDDRPGSPDKN